MNNKSLLKIMDLLKLGQLQKRPQRILGGRLHQLWRVDTDQGSYAIKRLNPQIICQPDALENFRRTESIAEGFYQNNIPVNVALRSQEDPLIKIDDEVYIVYDWINGETITVDHLSNQQAKLLGFFLGKIHLSELKIIGRAPDEFCFSESHWKKLTDKVFQHNFVKFEKLEQCLPLIVKANLLCKDANVKNNRHLVLSHCDIDTNNIIWQASDSPVIIDWELAGQINPMVDLLATGMLLSIVNRRRINEEKFMVVVNGYCKSGAKIMGDMHDAYQGVMEIWLGWLEYNLQRFVNDDLYGESERKLAEYEAINTLETFEASCQNDFLTQIEGLMRQQPVSHHSRSSIIPVPPSFP